MKAMVLAAGVGSRLDPLTASVPKPSVPVVNKPVMEHLLLLLKRHGITDVCANLHYLPEKLTEYFQDGSPLGMQILFEYEEKLSGDAGGVRACRKFLEDGTFIVIMGDLITDADLTMLVAEHKKKKAIASIAVKRMEDVTRFGVVVVDDNGFITGFQEKPKAEEALSNLISTGIYIFEPEVFEHIPATGDFGFGKQLFPKLVKEGFPVLGIEIETYWSDVGTIDQYREANLDVLSGLVKIDLGGTLLSKKESGGAQVLVGKNVSIGKNVTFQGRVVIGDSCVIDSGCVINDSVLWEGAHIHANSNVSESVIGANCLIAADSIINRQALVTPLVNELTATPARC
ncbi:MAG: NDP-sugar synthase [Candidatus Obscuribacterales bacterium]|nr:NDP-sugar synthase [Candidatus Obscuribacterales bacterium]